jgi:hypothetical protein
MCSSRADSRPDVHAGRPTPLVRARAVAPLLSLGFLVVGILGSFVAQNRWADVAFNHLGGLGIVGLMASLTAFVAGWKGRDQRTAFILGTLLPITLGVLTAGAVFFLTGFMYCGGGVVLLTSIVLVIVYSLIRRRRATRA